MRAIEAASLLERLSRGGEVELSVEEAQLLDAMIAAGLATEAPDTTAERAHIATLKGELSTIASRKTASPNDASLVARERALRTEILDLTERIARGDGATRVVTSASSGPYRGSSGRDQRGIVLTQRGRAIASNLGPRASRASGLSLIEFEAHMDALRRLFAWRAGRAMNIVNRIGTRAGAIEPSALRTVAIGLSGMRRTEEMLADAFLVLFGGIRQQRFLGDFTAAQDASAAEVLLLTAPDPQGFAYDARSVAWFVDLRTRLLRGPCAGRQEDALDSALLLAAVPADQHEARIAACAAFAGELSRHSIPIPLSLALLVGAEPGAASAMPVLVDTYRTLASETRDPVEALAAAVLVARAGGELDTQRTRLREMRAYLERFAPSGMTVAAALLTLVEGDAPGLLDDLRLASAEVQRYQLAVGGAEAMMHAIKLLVQSSLLAHGVEDDPEEGIALVARAHLSATGLGLGGTAATLPMVVSAVTTFHRPMLDAAVVYEQAYQPTHSDYVFGSGWGGGGGHSHSHHHHHHHHHRSIGWG